MNFLFFCLFLFFFLGGGVYLTLFYGGWGEKREGVGIIFFIATFKFGFQNSRAEGF